MSLEQQELETCIGLASRAGSRNTFFSIVMETSVFLRSKMTSTEEVEKKQNLVPACGRGLNAHLLTPKVFPKESLYMALHAEE